MNPAIFAKISCMRIFLVIQYIVSSEEIHSQGSMCEGCHIWSIVEKLCIHFYISDYTAKFHIGPTACGSLGLNH